MDYSCQEEYDDAMNAQAEAEAEEQARYEAGMEELARFREEHETKKFNALENMSRYGGSFVQALAECFRKADNVNFGRLKYAFPDIWEEYENFKK